MSQSADTLGSESFLKEARRGGVFTPEQTVWLCEHMGREQRKKMESLGVEATVGDRDYAAVVFEEMTGCLRRTVRKLNKEETAKYESIGSQSNAGSQQQVSARPGKEVNTSNSTLRGDVPKDERRVISLLDLSLLDYKKKVCKYNGKRQQRLAQALPAIDTTVGELGLKPEADWISQQKETVNSVARPSNAGSQHQGSFVPDGTHNRGASFRLDMRPIPKDYAVVPVPW
jgi:hypothetical protein